VTQHPRRAVFLPEVAELQGWDHEATLRNLLLKSGYTGDISLQLLMMLHVTRFQSSIACLTYEEYIRSTMPQEEAVER
jgi:AMMECR1 domain-containing protein